MRVKTKDHTKQNKTKENNNDGSGSSPRSYSAVSREHSGEGRLKKMTGEGRRGQREARKEGKNTKKRKQRKQMNKFMGHKMKRKTEGRKGAGVISGRFLLSGHRRCTQKHGEDSIKYHMQWPYCHGYGRVENINQALTCNRREDGGRRDGGKTAIGDGRRLAQHVFTVRVCVCVCVWLPVCFHERAHKHAWLSLPSMLTPKGNFFLTPGFLTYFDFKNLFLNEKKKSCYRAAAIKPASRLRANPKSTHFIQGWTHVSQTFVLEDSLCFRWNSYVQKKKKKKKEVCSCSLSHREEKKHV